MNTSPNYHPHPIAGTSGNPLAEAITLCHDNRTLLNNVTRKLHGNGSFWDLPMIYQQVQLMELHELHIPLGQFSGLYNKFASLILHGYCKRNPFSPESMRKKIRLAELLNGEKPKFSINEFHHRTTAPSVLVYGTSGMGKTTAIRQALGQFEQVISHVEYDGKPYKATQIVWLSFDMPATASPKALGLNFFKAVDDATGTTNYFEEYSQRSNWTVDKHLIGMQLVAQTHEIGIIHIDEVQFMTSYAKSKDSPNLLMLEALFNKLDIPVVLSCTHAGLTLFDSVKSPNGVLTEDMTTCRRGLSDREFRIDPLKLDSDPFNGLFNALFPAHLLLNSTGISQEFKQQFHFLSCGLVAVMTRLAQLYHESLLMMVNKKGKSEQYKTDDVEMLRNVFNDQFRLIQPALNLLRRKQFSEYEKALEKDESGNIAITDQDMEKIHQQKQEKSAPAIVKGGMFDQHSANSLNLNAQHHYLDGFGKQ
ncbi:AAA family ATPase [Pseudoalteromonas maricaloris]|uniref:AAA family ATPase n=1 Tax=Pseudoalteromonas maricaloris TaxID=184924 RepID=UPI003C1434EE